MIARQDAEIFLPGSTVGILGSGQLGRMFALAAKQMGYRTVVFASTPDSPAGQVADVEFLAQYDDLDAVARFAKQVDVITLEFENVPLATMEAASRHAPVRPGKSVLETTQHRLLEKTFLQEAGFPVGKFQAIRAEDLDQPIAPELFPGILKTATLGYDGKGQVVVENRQNLSNAWHQLNTDDAILEERIDLESEFSVVAARTAAGAFAVYPPIANTHRNHILHLSVSPSGLSPDQIQQATDISLGILDQLQVVGIICVEFFLARDGRMLVNEIAPRPHNSGHLTIEAHVTSQFEQQVRAVCGLNLGSTRQTTPAAMINVLGDSWRRGEPKWNLGLSLPNVKLHLYGKQDPQPGRKMGHLTAVADSPQQAADHAKAAFDLINIHDRFGHRCDGSRKSDPQLSR